MSRGRGQGSDEIGLRSISSDLNSVNPGEDIIGFRNRWGQASVSQRAEYIFPKTLDYADFSNLDLRGADLSSRSLYGVNLQGANLREANLTESDLRSVKWDVNTNFPLSEVNYRIDSDTADYIEKLKFLTPIERKFTEKNPNFMVMVENGIKTLFWLDENGDLDTPESPDENHTTLPALQRSLQLPSGEEIVITQEHYRNGKLHTNILGSKMQSARYSTEMDGTVIIENYEHGEPQSPYFAGQRLDQQWEGEQYLQVELLNLLWKECSAELMRSLAPQQIIAKPDGARQYIFYPISESEQPLKAELIRINTESDGSAQLVWTRGDQEIIQLNKQGDRIEKQSINHDDGGTTQTIDKFKVMGQGINPARKEHPMDSREQIYIKNKEAVESSRFPDKTESVSAKTITTYHKPIVYDNKVVKYERSRIEFYNSKDQLHYLTGPATVDFDENGKIMSRSYYVNGRKIRDAEAFVLATRMYRK